jgi:putative DNA primase/helicase
MWRRLRTIPFNVVIPPQEQDRNLSAKLVKEAEGVLAWAVQGARDWYVHGLPPTTDVDDAEKEWRRDADQIGRFTDQCCSTMPTAQVSARALYSAYKAWADSAGERAEAEKRFSERMHERGFEKERKESGNIYLGVGLLIEGNCRDL